MSKQKKNSDVIPDYGLPYYEHGTAVIRIPSKMVYFKKDNTTKQVSLDTITKILKTRTIDGRKIKAVSFKYIAGTTVKILDRGDVEDGESELGTIVIGVPLESLTMKSVEDDNPYPLHPTLTKDLNLKKIDDLYSVILKPDENINKPYIQQPGKRINTKERSPYFERPHVVKIPDALEKAIEDVPADLALPQALTIYKKRNELIEKKIKALNDKDTKQAKEYTKTINNLTLLMEALNQKHQRFGSTIQHQKRVKEQAEEKKRIEEARNIYPKRPRGRPRKTR
jgi:hypothetical protein